MKNVIGMILAITVGAVASMKDARDYFLPSQEVIDKITDQFGGFWDNIAANPLPVALAFSGFIVTVIYHKLKGRSLRESLEAAATRTVVVYPPAAPSQIYPQRDTGLNVLQRAMDRQALKQLLEDRTLIEQRHKELPPEFRKAEEDLAYAEKDLLESNELCEGAEKRRKQAFDKLEKLRKENANIDSEHEMILSRIKDLEGKV